MLAAASVLVATVALAVTTGTAAASSSWRVERSCGTPREGALTRNERWETTGPWRVRMSLATARGIARHVGPYEFQPADSHPPPSAVPCDIASTVSFDATDRWSVVLPAMRFSIESGWRGYATGPIFLFRCLVTARTSASARITCTHTADRHAGLVQVWLTARRRP
jgi:hypothetical protein